MFGLFKQTRVSIDPADKIKEGFLEKESRVRKVWRERWVVLTTKFLYTFEDKNMYVNPTETIDVNTFKTVKTDETKGGFAFVSIYLIFLWYNRNLMSLTLLFISRPKHSKKKKVG